MFLWVGLALLLASAHAQPLVDDSVPTEAPVKPNIKPMQRPVKPKLVDDDGQVPADVEFDKGADAAELQQVQRKFVLPMLNNVSKMLLSGDLGGTLFKVGAPFINGIAEMMMNYAIKEINSKKPVTRTIVFLLEGSKFVMEMMDFISKRGGIFQKILTAIIKFFGNMASKMIDG